LKPYPFSSDNGGLVIKARIPEDIIFRGVGGKACVGLWGFFLGCFGLGKRFIYCIVCHKISVIKSGKKMKNHRDKEEIRWQVVKAMLDEFPTLRQKVRNYVKTAEN
jgi:hypothetical protein